MNRTPNNQVKWCCWKIRFRGDIREISDSALTNTAPARSFAFTNFVFAGLSLPWKKILNFCFNKCELFQHRPTFFFSLFKSFDSALTNTAWSRNFSNFGIKYHSKNEKVRETVFVCSYGAQVESFKQKICKKSRTQLCQCWPGQRSAWFKCCRRKQSTWFSLTGHFAERINEKHKLFANSPTAVHKSFGHLNTEIKYQNSLSQKISWHGQKL